MFLPDVLARLNFLTTGFIKEGGRGAEGEEEEEEEKEEEEAEAIGKRIRETIIRRAYLTINASLFNIRARSDATEIGA